AGATPRAAPDRPEAAGRRYQGVLAAPQQPARDRQHGVEEEGDDDHHEGDAEPGRDGGQRQLLGRLYRDTHQGELRPCWARGRGCSTDTPTSPAPVGPSGVPHVAPPSPPYWAGTGNVAFHNALELARRGHDVTVLTSAVDLHDHRDPPEITVRRLPTPL